MQVREIGYMQRVYTPMTLSIRCDKNTKLSLTNEGRSSSVVARVGKVIQQE